MGARLEHDLPRLVTPAALEALARLLRRDPPAGGGTAPPPRLRLGRRRPHRRPRPLLAEETRPAAHPSQDTRDGSPETKGS